MQLSNQVQLIHHKKTKMTELHKVLLLEKFMKMQMQPSMVTIDLVCMFIKAKQVIISVKMLMVIKRKAKQEMVIKRMRTPIPILKHMMPMTRMYTLILIKMITVTLPRPPMVKIDLNCRIMKAKQVINPEFRHPKKNKMMEFGVQQGLPPRENHEGQASDQPSWRG